MRFREALLSRGLLRFPLCAGQPKSVTLQLPSANPCLVRLVSVLFSIILLGFKDCGVDE